jgi:hypothetical protein
MNIGDQLMRKEMRSSGTRAKKAAAKLQAQGSIRRLRGKVIWEGDLNQSRLARAQE